MGVLYRSQALALSPADLATIDKLGITADYDLRTTEEIAASPDVVPAGAAYTNFNVMADISLAPTLTSAASAEAYMDEIEQDFVTNPTAQAAFGTLLTDIANSNGSLYHCTAGKPPRLRPARGARDAIAGAGAAARRCGGVRGTRAGRAHRAGSRHGRRQGRPGR
jgi:Tyrosine phosphatase family